MSDDVLTRDARREAARTGHPHGVADVLDHGGRGHPPLAVGDPVHDRLAQHPLGKPSHLSDGQPRGEVTHRIVGLSHGENLVELLDDGSGLPAYPEVGVATGVAAVDIIQCGIGTAHEHQCRRIGEQSFAGDRIQSPQ